MSIKKMIEALLAADYGVIKIKPNVELHRYRSERPGNVVDSLTAWIRVPGCSNGATGDCYVIHSRDYKGIIDELDTGIRLKYEIAATNLINEIRNGYAG